ncbi:MAG: hypothetical protein BWK80_04505 [Desulfobacteraceae bacterium IS3]|nr:MAG: hypothetical protein BWK80_04505 [Desulfobacteraceae bacterium IS3]
MDAASLLFYMMTGAIGTAYFIYGKKKSNFTAVMSGIGLFVFPYFITNTYAVFAVGLVLIALPFIFRE